MLTTPIEKNVFSVSLILSKENLFCRFLDLKIATLLLFFRIFSRPKKMKKKKTLFAFMKMDDQIAEVVGGGAYREMKQSN